MNENTGEIRQFPIGVQINSPWVPLARLPNPQCIRCKGTGVRKITKKGRRLLCPCVR